MVLLMLWLGKLAMLMLMILLALLMLLLMILVGGGIQTRVGALNDGMLPVNTAGSPGGGLQWPSRGGGDLGGTCDADGVDADNVDTVGMAAGGSLVFPVSVAT